MLKRFVAVIITFTFLFPAFAQNYPQNYFRNPLNIPLQLVANFGEIRANHWHKVILARRQFAEQAGRADLEVFRISSR